MRKAIRIPHVIGVLVISTLLILAFSGCSGQAYAMEGTIYSLSPDGMSMTINGQKVIISPDVEITGTLVEGSVIKVKYVVQKDGSLIAQEINVEQEAEAEEEDLEVEGIVQSYALGASITVNGQTFIINGDTEIEGTPAKDTVVEVEYIVQDDGSLLALEIEVEDDED